MVSREQSITTTSVAYGHGSSQGRRQNIQFLGNIPRIVVITIAVCFALAPFCWTFVTSIKSDSENKAFPPTLIPQSFDLANYSRVLQNVPFFLMPFLNSIIIASVTTVLALLFGALCSYSLGRLKFVGKSVIFATFLSVNVLPFIAIVGPLFIHFVGSLRIYNTYAALIIPDSLLALPITTWFMTSFFYNLPSNLEDAARIDGASWLSVIRYIIAPLIAPGMFTAAGLSFIAVWNDFLFGVTFTSNEHAEPVTVSLISFSSKHIIAYGQTAAATILVIIPVVMIVLLLQFRIMSRIGVELK